LYRLDAHREQALPGFAVSQIHQPRGTQSHTKAQDPAFLRVYLVSLVVKSGRYPHFGRGTLRRLLPPSVLC